MVPLWSHRQGELCRLQRPQVSQDAMLGCVDTIQPVSPVSARLPQPLTHGQEEKLPGVLKEGKPEREPGPHVLDIIL